jgi:hypothetical protein
MIAKGKINLKGEFFDHAYQTIYDFGRGEMRILQVP